MADMKFRHAAALALVGWYLIVPDNDSPGFDYDEPLEQVAMVQGSIQPIPCMRVKHCLRTRNRNEALKSEAARD